MLNPSVRCAATLAVMIFGAERGALAQQEGRLPDLGPPPTAPRAEPPAAPPVGPPATVAPEPPLPPPQLAPAPARLGAARISSSPSGAQVYVDGASVGQSPLLVADLSPGEHVLEVRLSGYESHRRTLRISGGAEQSFAIDLSPLPMELGPAPLTADEVRGLTSVGGRAVRRGTFTADVGFGYPYFFDLRLTAGAWENGMGALDGGVQIRTFGSVTDIAAQGKLQFFAVGPIYAALHADFGGGGGPNGRSTFFGDIGPGLTLAFGNLVSFSARTWLELYTDRFCPSRDDKDSQPREDCLKMARRSDGTLYDPLGGRDNGARWYLGAWLDVAVWPHVSVFGALYGVPYQGQRLMFKGDYNPVFADQDPNVYGQIGLTVKD